MPKKYAIVYPAYTNSGDGLADMPSLFFIPFHKLAFEQVCGYSLGRAVEFYDDLDSAEKRFPAPNPTDNYGFVYGRQNAIIELDFEGNRAINFCKIYEIKGTLERLKKCDNSELFEKITLPKWIERNIKSTDFSRGALDEINKQFDSLSNKKEKNCLKC